MWDSSVSDSVEPEIFKTWWQGSSRFSSIVDPSGCGEAFKFDFEASALSADKIWAQIDSGKKFNKVKREDVFNDSKPLNLEIGMGNGEFLYDRALTEPDSNWLGIEIFKKVYIQAARLADTAPMKNMRVINFDAAFIMNIMEDESLDNVFVNFPDPWPKTRHHRRRLLKTPFLELIASKLKIGGVLNIATDHIGYAKEISANILKANHLRSLYESVYIKDREDYFHTKYYKKFADVNGVHYFKYERVR